MDMDIQSPILFTNWLFNFYHLHLPPHTHHLPTTTTHWRIQWTKVIQNTKSDLSKSTHTAIFNSNWNWTNRAIDKDNVVYLSFLFHYFSHIDRKKRKSIEFWFTNDETTMAKRNSIRTLCMMDKLEQQRDCSIWEYLHPHTKMYYIVHNCISKNMIIKSSRE